MRLVGWFFLVHQGQYWVHQVYLIRSEKLAEQDQFLQVKDDIDRVQRHQFQMGTIKLCRELFPDPSQNFLDCLEGVIQGRREWNQALECGERSLQKQEEKERKGKEMEKERKGKERYQEEGIKCFLNKNSCQILVPFPQHVEENID